MDDAMHPGARYRAVTAYTRSYPDPIVMRAGDPLQAAQEDQEWPGWVWCTAADGRSGWVPVAYVDRQGDRATARRDYSAIELSVAPGDELVAVVEESGWIWATNAQGETGWVPLQNLERRA
jgi:hypothetical protein